jgi:hypothetical protein
MAMLVPMKATGGPVTVDITIAGVVIWHYVYDADDVEFAKSGTSAVTNHHDLGTPDALNLDVNTWHIAVMNPTRVTESYSVFVEWKQGGQAIAHWPAKGPQKGTLKAGENKVFDDSALLASV